MKNYDIFSDLDIYADNDMPDCDKKHTAGAAGQQGTLTTPIGT